MKRKFIFRLLVNITVLGWVMGMMSGCASSQHDVVDTGVKKTWSQEDGIYNYKVGRFEVFVLVENQREGNAAILAGADEELLNRYIPESGFMHTTNAVLIKTGEKNILIDAGTGRQGEPVFEKIKKAGVEPEQIDAVLITHLHGDHFGGLVIDGNAAFPNAKIHLSAREYEFFIEEQSNEAAIAALELYGSNVETFEPGELGSELNAVFPGIFPVAAFGHTPGHTVFLTENGGDKLLIIGDLLHVALVQFPVPEISATFDMDPDASAVTRRNVLTYAAQNQIPVAGMHIVYPGIGIVETDGEGFKFSPVK